MCVWGGGLATLFSRCITLLLEFTWRSLQCVFLGHPLYILPPGFGVCLVVFDAGFQSVSPIHVHRIVVSRYLGIRIVVASGSLCGVVVNMLAWNARDVGLIPALSTIFPMFIIPTPLVL